MRHSFLFVILLVFVGFPAYAEISRVGKEGLSFAHADTDEIPESIPDAPLSS